MLLLENPQFLSNFFATLPKCLTHGWVILAKAQRNWIKIVDFPIKARFWLWVAVIVKSAIFTRFYWNFAKMSDTWVGHFDIISKTLDKNCGFSNKSTFLGQTSLWVAQKYAFIRKSPIFIGFFWYFAKMSDTWVGYFDKVSKKYDKNCWFSNKSTFLTMQFWSSKSFFLIGKLCAADSTDEILLAQSGQAGQYQQ